MLRHFFAIASLMLVCVIVYSQPLSAFKTHGNKIRGLTAEREVKMREALVTFEKIMNDTLFQKELLQKTFTYDVPNDPNRLLTTRQVTERIYKSSEWYRTIDDYTANIYWEIKNRRHISSTIGYGLPSDTTIYTYTWYFDNSANKADLVGHVAHEWSHKLKFIHLKKKHPGREYTVPYAFGNLIKRFAKIYYQTSISVK